MLNFIGSSYSIWKISDLKPGMNSITIFLFRRSHADLWKTSVGSVIGILNPKGKIMARVKIRLII